MRILATFFCIISIFLLTPVLSYAQSIDNGLSFQVSPQFPEAGDTFTLTLKGLETNRSSIQWFVDGVSDTTAKNQNSLTLVAGAIGEITTVVAKVTLLNGTIIEKRHSISPHRIDLVIEAETITPFFYNGRKLPTNGSTVHATAHIFTAQKLRFDEYSYLWKVNNKTQNGGALRGENSFSFVPGFEDMSTVSVDIFDKNGQLIASKAQEIPIVKPELFFYEVNPLRGLSFVALVDPYIFIGDETKIRGEGYFMSELEEGELHTEWKIDGKTTSAENSDLQELTLKKEQNSGKVNLSFHIRNLTELLQGVQKSITIQF